MYISRRNFYVRSLEKVIGNYGFSIRKCSGGTWPWG